MVIEKLFVTGSNPRISDGIVGEEEVSVWRQYLKREGQPFLAAPAEVKSVVRATPLPPSGVESPTIFLLEHLDPELDSLFPAEVTWRLYFREVHSIEADSTHDLVLALRAAGWPESQIARFNAINLDDAIPRDAPEFEEHEKRIIEAAEVEDVFIGPEECAFALVQELTESFKSQSPESTVIGKLRLLREEEADAMREAHAIGELTLTALQELFNAMNTGIQILFWRETDPPPWAFFDKH